MVYTRKIKCIYCKKEFIQRRHKQKYCGTSCQMRYEYENGIRDKFKTGENARKAIRQKSIDRFKAHPNMIISKRGYKMIYIPMNGWKKYHHYIWEKNYGNILNGYAIHHINLNKLDNRIENLQMIEKHEHHKLHDKLRKRNKKGEYE